MKKIFNYFENLCDICESDLNKMPKYEIGLLINAIDNINIDSTLNDTLSGEFYNCLGIIMEEKNMYDDAKNKYLTSIEKGNLNAIYNLGYYYYRIEKNYNEAEKYWCQGVKNNDSDSYCNLEICIKKSRNYESFINCHVDLIKNKNLIFVNKLNEFVNRNFYQCLKSIAGNANILQKHLDILKNINIVDKNYCVNCG